MHFVDDYSDDSDDDNKECLVSEIKWPLENKLVTFPSLRLIHKNWNEEMKLSVFWTGGPQPTSEFELRAPNPRW